jgi:predicted transcriptional regulator
MTQEIALVAIKNMPHDFNIDELMERLIVLEKLEEAERDVEAGRVISHSEVQKLFEEWTK